MTRYLAYARIHEDLGRVAVNQSSREKACSDAKAHASYHGESWLYQITAERHQILISHYVKGQGAPTTAPEVR